MQPSSIYLTAYITALGLYEFKRLAMGLRNDPASFSRGMHVMTKSLDNVLVYIDDCNLYSKRPRYNDIPGTDDELWQDHYNSVAKFLRLCRASNLKLNGEKSISGKADMECLGHIITPEGLKPNLEKVKAVRSFKRPEDQGNLRSFLGLIIIVHLLRIWRNANGHSIISSGRFVSMTGCLSVKLNLSTYGTL